MESAERSQLEAEERLEKEMTLVERKKREWEREKAALTTEKLDLEKRLNQAGKGLPIGIFLLPAGTLSIVDLMNVSYQ